MYSSYIQKQYRLLGINEFFKSPGKLTFLVLMTAAFFVPLFVSGPLYGENFLQVFDPEYGNCGNVLINGIVNTDEELGYRIFGLVWDWGDGQKNTSWFSASHRYTENGDYTVQVTAAGCPTMIQTKTVQIDSAEDPGCPPAVSQLNYYLVPYNMHLVVGMDSSVPLHVVDQDGNAVYGNITFEINNPPLDPLISIASSGTVTPLRTETPNEIGVWVSAKIDGLPVSNNCVVRVLENDYSTVPFAETATAGTSLYYPTVINGEDIAAAVNRFQMAAVNEYARQIQGRLMGTSPFKGARQIWEVDFGTTEENRVCGISGNPIRLGWNIVGNIENPAWRNCFLVPWPLFAPARSPQWGVMYHELGHNMTWDSPVFGAAMDHWLYSEGLATAISLSAMEEILGNQAKYPLGSDARTSLDWICYTSNEPDFLQAREDWLDAGAVPDDLTPDVVDGIWLFHKVGVPHFPDRFFLPLQPLMAENMGEMLCELWLGGDAKKHTFFAALMSAAAGTDLYTVFAETYHYPLIPAFYSTVHAALTEIIVQRECPGDFDKDGSSDEADLTLFAVDFGKTGCSGVSCNGDFNNDGDVDGSELAAFILKFGRTDCL
jgi:PKD repeat protein